MDKNKKKGQTNKKEREWKNKKEGKPNWDQ